MKIAVVTDDGKTIAQHFGRASKYAVVELTDKEILSRELRDKPGHHSFQHEGEHHHEHGAEGRGAGAHAEDKHSQMVAVISDCEALLARGMGRGVFLSMENAGIRPLTVDFSEIDEALKALMDGSIDEHIHQQLCGDHHH